MREIKFRFFDGEKMCPVGELTFFEPSGYNINEEFPSTGAAPYPLMQYTGLKDKNGVEICEGDVVQKRNGSISEVRFGEYCFTGGEYSTQGVGFYLYTSEDKGMFGQYDFPTKSEKVIGNIYQNPELLAK